MSTKIRFTLLLLILLLFIAMLLSEAINPIVDKEKADITTYYMYPGKNRLVIEDSLDKSDGKEKVKIFYNDKDYTRFAEKLLASQPISFASCRIVVFGKEKMVCKNKQWHCKKGVLFIPGEKEVIIIEATGILLDEDTSVINLRKGNLKHISIL